MSTSSSVQPTSSITTSAPAPPLDDSTAFSPTSSPPLILAFLAIALFAVAMVFIFWRRIQSNRGWTLSLPNMNRPFVEPTAIIHAEVPKLWDLTSKWSFVWGQEQKGTAGLEDDVRWVNLMVCVRYFQDIVIKLRVAINHSLGFHHNKPLSVSTNDMLESPPAERNIGACQHSLNNFLNTIPNLNSLSWRNHTQSSSCRDDGEKKLVDGDEMKVLQVTVSIALPSAQFPIYIKNRNIDQCHEGMNKDRRQMIGYCIGMYEGFVA